MPSRRHRSETSTLGCMPASTIRSFSAAVHFRRWPFSVMVGPPGRIVSIVPSPEEAVSYLGSCAIYPETLHVHPACVDQRLAVGSEQETQFAIHLAFLLSCREVPDPHLATSVADRKHGQRVTIRADDHGLDICKRLQDCTFAHCRHVPHDKGCFSTPSRSRTPGDEQVAVRGKADALLRRVKKGYRSNPLFPGRYFPETELAHVVQTRVKSRQQLPPRTELQGPSGPLQRPQFVPASHIPQRN